MVNCETIIVNNATVIVISGTFIANCVTNIITKLIKKFECR